jgi:glycosyltransferase involved in cell wall biosynthesis
VIIGIEILKAHHKDGGFGVYPRKLILNILNNDNINNYYIFTSQIIPHLEGFDNCQQILVNCSDGFVGFVKKYFKFKKIINNYRLDVLHLLSMYGVHRPSVATVSTVFDLRHLVQNDFKERRFGKLIYKYILKYLLKESSHIIAISDETKSNLIKFFNIPDAKITVTYLGHEIESTNEKTPNEVFIPSKYFMWVGLITNRKNLETLFKAFSVFLKKNSEYYLLIVGNYSKKSIQISHQKLVDSLDITEHVIFSGYINDNDLISIYKKAEAFVFPSLYEGFGIPIIEAMSLNVPVITTIDGGATKEVAGDAALYFEKYDFLTLAEKMSEISTNQKLRATCIKKGLNRAKRFTWQATAMKTLNVYEKFPEKDEV